MKSASNARTNFSAHVMSRAQTPSPQRRRSRVERMAVTVPNVHAASQPGQVADATAPEKVIRDTARR